MISDFITDNYIEIFGALTGIIYVFLEIRQNIWLWPVGIATSAAYIWIFLNSGFYADMSLQGYYLIISIVGWYWWLKGTGRENHMNTEKKLQVSHIQLKTGIILAIIWLVLIFAMYQVLTKLTDSPVPVWDSFITSLSIIATWMLARKIYEHWYLWIIVNFVSSFIFILKGLYPTTVLYIIYGIMSIAGLFEWRKSFTHN